MKDADAHLVLIDETWRRMWKIEICNKMNFGSGCVLWKNENVI